MSMRSLADFMEASPRSVRRLACTATVTGRGDPHVDASARGADFSWPKTGTSRGHQCGLLMATDNLHGLAGPIRTDGPCLRRAALCPAELRRGGTRSQIQTDDWGFARP